MPSDAFVDMLDLASLDFEIEPEATGCPGYHPASMLKLYVYGYLNQVQSSRRLERECARNLERRIYFAVLAEAQASSRKLWTSPSLTFCLSQRR